MDYNNILRHNLDIFEERRNIENNIDIYIESYYSKFTLIITQIATNQQTF